MMIFKEFLVKISVITVCFNSEKTIDDTIKSVLSQTHKDYEHIIVDGCSKDGTLLIVENYKQVYGNKLKVISENDNGLYDAMNKGLALATGDIIGILNSDDVFAHDKVLEKISSTFENEGCDGTYSDLEFKDFETMSIKKRVFRANRGSIYTGWHPPHPTLYLKKSVYEKIGNFDLKFRIAADFDFMIRLLKDKTIKLSYIKESLIFMRLGGVSTYGLKGYYKSLKEAHNSLKKNKIKFRVVASFCRIVRFVLQIIFK